MRFPTLLALGVLFAGLAGCDAISKLTGKESDRAAKPTREDCDRAFGDEKDGAASAGSAVPKCPACPPAIPAGPGMCDALRSLQQAPEAARVVLGDVELSRNGMILNDVDRLASTMTGKGKAEAVDPLIATTAMLLKDKRELRTTVLASMPADKDRRKAMKKLLKSGRLPEPKASPAEIIVGHKLAAMLGASEGDVVSVASLPLPGLPAPPVRDVKIVGLLDLPGDPLVDYDSEFLLADVEDVRTIGLFREKEWTAMRVWYREGERAAGLLSIHEALAAEQMTHFVSVDQRLIALNTLRPTLEALCSK